MAKRKIKKSVKKKLKITTITTLALLITATLIISINYYSIYSQKLTPKDQTKKYYNISDFGFIKEKSKTDYNNNDIDDYTEFLNAEKQFAKWNPKNISKYYDNAYPEIEKEGVSADLIWYALKTAGYDLRKMVDKDIEKTEKKNTYNIETRDPNIDFRRVQNLDTFFYRNSKILQTDIYEIGTFMPGDIIILDNNELIGMVSDKYNQNGVPYIILNRGENQTQKEEDYLEKSESKVTSHYRFEYNNKIQELINEIN